MSTAKRAPATGRTATRRRTRRRPSYLLRAFVAALGLAVAVLAWAAAARSLARRANSSRSSFDAILVLGTPTDSDGNPTPALLDRVSEGVREYERGVAPRLVMTGAAAHNRFVEAEAMARVARSQGVPASAILVEPRALDTIQNLCYSAHILHEHGWHSAEIVSSASHLPRASIIAAHLPRSLALEYRVHGAPETPGAIPAPVFSTAEVLKTARYLVWARWVEPCEP